MAGHFECIGVLEEEELIAVVDAALGEGDASDLDGSREIVWRDADGASLAVSVTSDGEVQCVRPSFASASRVRARIGTVAEDPECAFCSRLLVDVLDDDGELLYPLAVELERHALARSEDSRGRDTRLAVAVFAETLEAWPSEDAYYEAAEGGGGPREPPEPVLAPQSLIPTGLFVEKPTRSLFGRSADEGVPTAHALVTGIVRDSASRRNSVTGNDFRWLEVDSYGTTYDLVAAATEASEVTQGAVVQGGCWLIARLGG